MRMKDMQLHPNDVPTNANITLTIKTNMRVTRRYHCDSRLIRKTTNDLALHPLSTVTRHLTQPVPDRIRDLIHHDRNVVDHLMAHAALPAQPQTAFQTIQIVQVNILGGQTIVPLPVPCVQHHLVAQGHIQMP